MSRRLDRALWTGPVIPVHPDAARALGSAYKALAVQQLHFYGLRAEDGWVPMSAVELSATIGCSPSHAGKILKSLADRGLLELGGRDRHGRHRYRVDYQGCRALLPRWALSDEAQQHALTSRSHRAQNEGPRAPHFEGPNPHQDRARGVENGLLAGGQEERREEGEGDLEELPPPPAAVVARETGESGGGGGKFKAQFPSLCANCGGRIEPGDLQRAYTGSSGKRSEFVHAVCPPPSGKPHDPIGQMMRARGLWQ